MSRCLLIRAIIRREKLPEVLKALVDSGIQGATVYREVEGMGGEGGVVVIGGEVYDVLTPRVAIDIVADEKEVEKGGKHYTEDGEAEAVDLVVSHFRRGEWASSLTMWLEDGEAKRREVLRGDYQLVIATKEPWRLGLDVGTYEALIATGKKAFVKLREAAGVYGELLDLLKAHK